MLERAEGSWAWISRIGGLDCGVLGYERAGSTRLAAGE